ncbi:hypothetical protein PORY_000411 [Pneumocystis oryctolagi]|uniref:Uncharacterized protein n=1 Tax=Pneumocystis oryctolagi TaxID=42067 RepID=A0ACB7CGW2_9ASCO|nr:hypothetical protein PORY_000411 [Pneumocystis oryctolagi]
MNQTKEDKDESKKIPKFSSFKAHLREAQYALRQKYEKQALFNELKSKESYIEDKNDKKKDVYEGKHKFKTIEKNKPFIIDLTGDVNNVIYGKNDRYSIPHYRRFGNGCVIGCEEHIKLWAYPENPNEVVLSSFLNYNKYQKYVNLEVDMGTRPIEDDEFSFNKKDDYIPLEIETSDTTSVTENLKTDSSVLNPEYSEAENGARNALNIWKKGDVQLEIKELSKKIETSASDYKLWLELVDKQDKILWKNQRKNSKEEQISIGNVKLKILEDALSHCPDNEDLLLKYVSIITLIWEPKKVDSKWDEILKKTSSLSIWKKYLDSFQTNSISFTHSQCLEKFQNSFQTLKEASKNEKCSQKKENIEEIMLYILVRIWFYMKEAGYIENSIASIQALIEFNFFRPDAFSCNTNNDYLDEFEQFWESEAPRFGEDGSKGWKNYYNVSNNIISFKNDSNDVVSNTQNMYENNEDKYVVWCKQELAGSLSVNPKRSTDTNNENDPYSVVLFSDIKQLLYFFTSNKIRLNIVYLSLHFLGFSLYRMNKTSNDPLFLDSFIQNFSSINLFDWFYMDSYICSKSSELSNENTTNFGNTLKRSKNPLQFGLKNWPITIDTLFSIDKIWYQNLDFDTFHKDFIKRYFEQLENVINDDMFSMLHLLFQNYYSSSDVRKLAKSILKKKPSNIKLWCAYAQLEYLNGNLLETRKIFLNILENIKLDHTEKSYDCIVAYKLWAEIEMKSNEIGNSIKILVSMVENELDIKNTLSNNEKTYPDAVLLKAQKSFQHLNRLALSFKNYKVFRLYTECYALLSYLVKSLNNALEIYYQAKNSFNECTDSGLIEYEQLLVSELKLLYYCSQTTKVFKISSIQDRVKDALSKFPNNCIFLSIFLWAEEKSLLKTKIYHYFEKNIFKAEEPSFIIFLFAIWTEIYINSYRVNIHPIRCLFERAVENQTTKSDLIIWRLYIEFEIRYGTLDKGKAVFYRAIRDCPWSKNLILLAFNELRSQFNSEELIKLYNTMIERELRIFVDLEIEKDVQEINHLPLITLPKDISSDEME